MLIGGEERLDEAAEALKAGRLVAFPTETVYGLGADATNARAVASIFDAKGRPRFNPLIVHAPDRESAFAEAEPTPLAERLAAAFWPGPLTLVVRRSGASPVSEIAMAGLDSIALRVPALPLAQVLLRRVGRPVVAPSANRSGRVSATTAAHVAADLAPYLAMVLDGGPTQLGLESTVIDARTDRPLVLRPGGLTVEAIREATGLEPELVAEIAGQPTAPGQLTSHYAPSLPVRHGADRAAADEALLAFGPAPPEGAAVTLNLSPAGDLVEAAANLFDMLRRLDRTDLRAIAVMPIPEVGLGRAINDRLRRAAAPRE